MPDFESLKFFLDQEVARYNTPEFIEDDPVRFPRMFTDVRDVEITSLLVSAIAWGRRPMILKSAEKMLALMEHQPYAWMADRAYEELPDGNIHRTFFAANLRHFMRGLHLLYSRYGTLDALAASLRPAGGHWHGAAWEIAAEINRALCEANDGRTDCRCLPLNADKSALKRFNMALRWLVRDDGIVDTGLWKSVRPSELYIPLDVHVGNISRQLGLTDRRANDRRTVEDLTAVLARMCPDDPVKYDFALFGIGVSGRHPE